ncbi:hypothetical protein ACWCP0_42155, partial [Streptomyces sp. NPDC001970]
MKTELDCLATALYVKTDDLLKAKTGKLGSGGSGQECDVGGHGCLVSDAASGLVVGVGRQGAFDAAGARARTALWGGEVAGVSQDGSLQPFVDLIDKHGTDKILTAVGQLDDEPQADVIVSTAHKAKGREWPTVKIADDFTP